MIMLTLLIMQTILNHTACADHAYCADKHDLVEHAELDYLALDYAENAAELIYGVKILSSAKSFQKLRSQKSFDEYHVCYAGYQIILTMLIA